MLTRLFYLTFVSSLSLNIKNKNNQKVRGFHNIFSRIFNINCWTHILSIHNVSLGSCEVPHKIWARSVQPFWRSLNTNKKISIQTPRHPSKVYIDYFIYHLRVFKLKLLFSCLVLNMFRPFFLAGRIRSLLHRSCCQRKYRGRNTFQFRIKLHRICQCLFQLINL